MSELAAKENDETIGFYNRLSNGEQTIVGVCRRALENTELTGHEKRLLEKLIRRHENLIHMLAEKIEADGGLIDPTENDYLKTAARKILETPDAINLVDVKRLEKMEIDLCEDALENLILEDSAENFVNGELIPLKRENVLKLAECLLEK